MASTCANGERRKKTPGNAGALSCWKQCARSVTRDDRAAEFVVDACARNTGRQRSLLIEHGEISATDKDTGRGLRSAEAEIFEISLHAKHPVAALPVVARLTATGESTWRKSECIQRGNQGLIRRPEAADNNCIQVGSA